MRATGVMQDLTPGWFYFLRLEALAFFLADDFALALDFERAAGFLAAERLVVVEPLELELLFTGAAAWGGAGVAAGALADAARVRPPATATSGWKPSSANAIRAPAVIAIAAARPKNTPIFSVGEPANMSQRISRTARAPSRAVVAPRGAGMLTRCPAAAR